MVFCHTWLNGARIKPHVAYIFTAFTSPTLLDCTSCESTLPSAVMKIDVAVLVRSGLVSSALR
jgi:hypothetical protein